MDLSFTKASSLAIIDRKIGGIAADITPAQYEIIRQVIYATADLNYQSLLKFSESALTQGAAALTAMTPIIVDVPEIQVSIVPKLQKTFGNPVYCCATINAEIKGRTTRAARGLEILGSKYPHSIFIIGQDQTALSSMIALLRNKVIEPSLAIATPPTFLESSKKQRLIESSVPYICLNTDKGGANIASAIFNSLIGLTWQTYPQDQAEQK
ncbi:MAG: precorrin-8X methylmutase [Cyanobacteria bacterium P01_E01_bin.35]